jgi:molybdopterin synthase catalytic subunit
MQPTGDKQRFHRLASRPLLAKRSMPGILTVAEEDSMIMITREPISPELAYGLIGKKNSGSVVLHYAVVKEQTGSNRPTTCIDYRSDGDTDGELAKIAADIKDEWTLEDVLLIRRIGCLDVGEIISLVAASSPNSEDAFEACKQGISRLKKMSTIKKQEQFHP